MSADSLGFGELQSFLAGCNSFQYLSAVCITVAMKDLTEICCISSALEMPILWESTAAKVACLDFLAVVVKGPVPPRDGNT